MNATHVELRGSDARQSSDEISDDVQLLGPHQVSRRPFPGLPLKWNRPCTAAVAATLIACVSVMLVILCYLKPHDSSASPLSDRIPSVTQAPCTPLPAANNSMYLAVRARAAAVIRSIHPTLPPNTWAYLVGGLESSLGYSDTEVPFRQESNFLYLTGWNMSGAVALFSIDDASLHLLLQVICCILHARCFFIVIPVRSGQRQTLCGTGPESRLNPPPPVCNAMFL
jgi:hypothetical protein